MVPATVVDALRRESEAHSPCETGGILLGTETSAAAEVLQVVDAGPAAEREHARFTPDGPWQRARVAELYEASGRTLNYLGDWHSHPRGGRPSGLDRATAARIAATTSARCPRPVFLLVTRDRERWVLKAYRYVGRRFRQMAVLEG